MVSFKTAATGLVTLRASFGSSDAAYMLHTPSRPRRSTALGARLFSSPLQRNERFSRDVKSAFHDFDRMFDSVIEDLNAMIYQPLGPLDTGGSSLSALPPSDRALARAPRATYQSSQDEQEVRIAFHVPGASVDDIKLELDDEARSLRVSGQTKFEDDHLIISSKFDRSFEFGRNVDTSRISAKFADGVLAVTAPKIEREKTPVRTLEIDIVENQEEIDETPGLAAKEEIEVVEAGPSEGVQPEGDSVVDLDVATK